MVKADCIKRQIKDMKKLIAILMLAVMIMLPAEAKKKNKSEDGNALIVFNEESHDFGIINTDKGVVTHEFEFVNQGNAPLVLTSVTAECGCTRPEYPKNPIAPGKKGKIRVNFIPQGYQGSFSKNVKVKSNGSKKMKVLKITGIVNPNGKK